MKQTEIEQMLIDKVTQLSKWIGEAREFIEPTSKVRDFAVGDHRGIARVEKAKRLMKQFER